MSSISTRVRTFAAIVLFAFGMLAGSIIGNAAASPSSTAPCTTDTRAQAAPVSTWEAPPQNTSGHPGQPY